MTRAPEIIRQGKTVVERDGEGFLVMHPDGQVTFAPSRSRAEHIAKRWYEQALGSGSKIGIGEIEWRSTK
jgi:hypothetical protein